MKLFKKAQSWAVAAFSAAAFAASASGSVIFNTVVAYNGTNGANPMSDVLLVNGKAINTTFAGGANNLGTVSSIDLTTHVQSFASLTGTANGANPTAGTLALGPDQNVYFNTHNGGSGGVGTFDMYTVNTNTITPRLNLTTATGDVPQSGTIYNSANDRFYLTGFSGGTSFLGGTVTEINNNTQTGTAIRVFSSGNTTQGVRPVGVTLHNGVLYGTTFSGGAGGSFNGTQYSVTTDSSHTFTSNVTFNANTNGSNPESAPVFNAQGDQIVTLSVDNVTGNGALVKISGNTVTVLKSFLGGPNDGANPQGSVFIDGAGNIFGTLENGGAFDDGGVFELAANGDYNFWALDGTQGSHPVSSLTVDYNTATLYFTAKNGGLKDDGAVLALTGTNVAANASTPEPQSLAFLALGASALLTRRRLTPAPV